MINAEAVNMCSGFPKFMGTLTECVQFALENGARVRVGAYSKRFTKYPGKNIVCIGEWGRLYPRLAGPKQKLP